MVAPPLKGWGGVSPGHAMCVLPSCIARRRGRSRCADEVNLPQFDTELLGAAIEKEARPIAHGAPSVIGHICSRQRESGRSPLTQGSPTIVSPTLFSSLLSSSGFSFKALLSLTLKEFEFLCRDLIESFLNALVLSSWCSECQRGV